MKTFWAFDKAAFVPGTVDACTTTDCRRRGA